VEWTEVPLCIDVFLTTREAARVCMYVNVCQTITFERVHVGSSFSHVRYKLCLQGIQHEFVHEGLWVNAKITGAKMGENSYSRNVKLRSDIPFCQT